MLERLAQAVIDNWEKGDLAAAVRDLDVHLKQERLDRQTRTETIETARKLYAEGFLRSAAARWKARREAQELKVGSVKHATRQFEFFAGALSAAEALGYLYNPMVLILLIGGDDAVELFANKPDPEGTSET